MIGDYVPRSKMELGVSGAKSDISELSDEELARISNQLEAGKTDQGDDPNGDREDDQGNNPASSSDKDEKSGFWSKTRTTLNEL